MQFSPFILLEVISLYVYQVEIQAKEINIQFQAGLLFQEPHSPARLVGTPAHSYIYLIIIGQSQRFET